jgi:hypothetical protein
MFWSVVSLAGSVFDIVYQSTAAGRRHRQSRDPMLTQNTIALNFVFCD